MGGIYTVLQTKAKVTGDEWGDNYYLVGPYTEQGVRTQVELLEPPTPALKRTLDSMNSKGCKVGHGLAKDRVGAAEGAGGGPKLTIDINEWRDRQQEQNRLKDGPTRPSSSDPERKRARGTARHNQG